MSAGTRHDGSKIKLRVPTRAADRSAPVASSGAWPEFLDAETSGNRLDPQRVMLALLVIGIVVLYGPVGWSTLADCWNDPNYSHGVLVPLLVLILMNQRHHDVFRLTARRLRLLQRLAWTLLAVGCALFVLGTAAAEQFTVRVSAVLVAAALCGTLGGAARLRRYAMPLALLVCMIPLPYVVYYRVTFPLQLLAARLAAGALDVLGMNVSRTGNIVDVNGHALEVVRACSGIRSMMTLGTLAAALAVGLRLGARRAVPLLVVAVPAALCGNVLRLVATALLVVRFGPAAAEGTLHEAVGVVSFVLPLVLVFAAATALRQNRRAVFTKPKLNAGPAHQLARGWAWMRSIRLVSLRAACASLVLLAATGAYAGFVRGHLAEPGAPPALARLPMRLGGLEGHDIALEPAVLKQVQADAYVFRSYQPPAGPDIGLYVGYYRSARQGAQIHSPMHCYPGAGWDIEQSSPLLVRDLHGNLTEMRRLLVEQDGAREVVVYWYDTRTGRLTSDLQLKLNLMRTALLHQPQDAAFIRWSTAVQKHESVEDATTRLLSATARAFPHLDSMLPFGS